MIFDHISNYESYFKSPLWAKAFKWLDGIDETIEDGRHDIEGDKLFALTMHKKTVATPDETILETHEKYADIQVLLSGKERIQYFYAPNLEIETPYDAEIDKTFYKKISPLKTCLILEPNHFVFFSPQDAHMPELAPENEAPAMVHKVVFKVALSELI